MGDITIGDLERMYSHSTVFYDDVLYYVERIRSHEEIVMVNLLTSKRRTVAFDMKRFVPPGAVGYVNQGGVATYVVRIPRRIYYVGLSDQNIQAKPVGRPLAPSFTGVYSRQFAYAVYDLYPTLEEAIYSLAVENHLSVAFNKQFAIDRDHNLYYRTKIVGKVVDNKCVFNKGKEFLSNLFRTEDVKNLRKA